MPDVRAGRHDETPLDLVEGDVPPVDRIRSPVLPCTLHVHARRVVMSVEVRRHKHLKLDQQKIDFAKRYFGVTSEQEAIDRALALLMQEEHIVRRLKALRGALRGDDRAWPYS